MKIHPPFAQPDPGRRAEPIPAASSAPVEAHTDLPPIEHFVDDLPSIDEFLAAPEPESVRRETPQEHDWSEVSRYRPTTPPESSPVRPRAPVSHAPEIDSEGWATADWQSYDWNKVASLGAPPADAMEANAAWSATDWDTASRHLSDLAGRAGGFASEEVASALDEIARRIRSGELSLERFHGTPPEAAIAAVFAALLRTRG